MRLSASCKLPSRSIAYDLIMLSHVDIGRCELPTFLPEEAVDFDVLKFSRHCKLSRESRLPAPSITDDDDA
jgi:hypothetical protein